MISVIIPAKNASDTIASCLDGVLSQQNLDVEYEIILVDDGSEDDTGAIAHEKGVTVIRQENAGPAAARNAGAHRARGDLLAFTDSDCVPSPNWLYHLTCPFQELNVVGAKGTYRTHRHGLVPRFVQQEYEYKYRKMAKLENIDFIDTYSAAYRRRIFLENGGFDDAFAVPSVEDQELSFRLARKGYRMVFATEAYVHHQHDRDLIAYAKRKWGIGYWKAFMLRWLPEKAFQDSHTPGTLRWQILFLATFLFSMLLAPFWSAGWWLIVVNLLGFYGFALPFMLHISRHDRAVLLVTPAMLLVRAGALGFGLAWGLIFPPRREPRLHPGLSPLERFFKRTMDIIGALIGLILSAPLLMLAGIAIKLDSRGAIFFTQDRAGENGKTFRIFKLRTMVSEAQYQVEQVLKGNPLVGPVYKIPNDPRVTRVGRFLRRWSIDEIPQFWNILRGDMSLVGPRPEETWVVDQYTDKQRQRLAVKPGLTGSMQISGRGELDMHDRLALEIEYINNYSLWKDIIIIFRTIPTVFSGKGAF